MPDVNAAILPLRRPRLAPNRIGRPERQRLVTALAGPKEPRSSESWTARPRPVHTGLVFAVPEIIQGKGPRIEVPALAQGTGIAVERHIPIENHQPAILGFLRAPLPEFLTGGRFLPPCGS